MRFAAGISSGCRATGRREFGSKPPAKSGAGYLLLPRVFACVPVAPSGMRYVVAHCMVDFCMVDVDGDAGFDGAFPDNIVDPQRVKITTELWQRDRVTDSRN